MAASRRPSCRTRRGRPRPRLRTRSRDDILAEVRQRLLQAQQLSKRYYDANHRELEFAVGDWVWLRLLHRTAQSLDPSARHKLGPRYARPFQVLERIGSVAYHLQLP